MQGRPGELERLENLLRNMARIVPGYPLELARLARLAVLLEKRMAETLNDTLRPLDLTSVLYSVMVVIQGSEGGVATPSDLAQQTGERPNNVTHICKYLEQRDLITRHHASGDRRRMELSLTLAGSQLLGRAQTRVWEIWRRRFRNMDAPQRELLYSLLRSQIVNLGREP